MGEASSGDGEQAESSETGENIKNDQNDSKIHHNTSKHIEVHSMVLLRKEDKKKLTIRASRKRGLRQVKCKQQRRLQDAMLPQHCHVATLKH